MRHIVSALVRSACRSAGVWTATLAAAVGFGLHGSATYAEAAREISPDHAAPSCFLGGIAHPQANLIEGATVFIAVLRPGGELLSEGTGFVVADSAVENGHFRIVTAAHVVDLNDTGVEDAFLTVFFSDGIPIGRPKVIAAGEPHSITVEGSQVVVDDLSVLEISHFMNPTVEDRYSRLQGLPIESGDALMVGEADKPFGAVWGFSGAAAVDSHGRVVGVLTEADFRGRISVDLGSIQDANNTGRARPKPIALPPRSLVVVEPIHSADILRALGLPGALQATRVRTSVVMAGYPLGACASISAELEPVETTTSAALLAKWRSMGDVGAWYLPPHLSSTKLKLIP